MLFAALSGFLFAVGLAIGGMTDTANVLGFLDVAGDWKPALAFVMFTALVVYGLLARAFSPPPPPTVTAIDGKLVGGAALFGIGWGLVGYCPGPALASLGVGGSGTVLFVVAMLGGFVAHRLVRGAA